MQGDDKHKRERFVMSVAYSPDGKLIACGTQIGTVAIFDVEAGRLVSVLEGHYKPVRSLTFTPGTFAHQCVCLLSMSPAAEAQVEHQNMHGSQSALIWQPSER